MSNHKEFDVVVDELFRHLYTPNGKDRVLDLGFGDDVPFYEELTGAGLKVTLVKSGVEALKSDPNHTIRIRQVDIHAAQFKPESFVAVLINLDLTRADELHHLFGRVRTWLKGGGVVMCGREGVWDSAGVRDMLTLEGFECEDAHDHSYVFAHV
jgi:hypothetical protein